MIRNRKQVCYWRSWMIVGMGSLSLAGFGLAQDAPPATAPLTQASGADAPEKPKDFAELLIEWKNIEGDLQAKQQDFDRSDDILQRDTLRRQYADLVMKSNQILDNLREAALKKLEVDGMDPLILRTLMGILVNDANNGRDQIVLAAADELISKKIDPRNWEAAAKLDRLSIPGKEVFEEIRIRQTQTQAGDLPQAKIVTNRGEILVELYENEAPNTVANFISLAKAGFYNGLKFHRVIEGFMAQTGSPKGDGSDGPGYTIPDECTSPEARRHFTGVLSMAKTQLPDSGGSQFFITFSRNTPVQALDGKHTVFGRVLSGDEVLGRITRTHQSLGMQEQVIAGSEADNIVKIEIIRDRGHEYKPQKVVGERKPDEAPKPDDMKSPEEKANDKAAESADPSLNDEAKKDDGDKTTDADKAEKKDGASETKSEETGDGQKTEGDAKKDG